MSSHDDVLWPFQVTWTAQWMTFIIVHINTTELQIAESINIRGVAKTSIYSSSSEIRNISAQHETEFDPTLTRAPSSHQHRCLRQTADDACGP